MKRFLFLFAFITLATSGLSMAQMALISLDEHRSTYENTRHVPAEAWESNQLNTSASTTENSIGEAQEFEMSLAPNPAEQEVTFSQYLPKATSVKLDLIDASGQFLGTIFESAEQKRGLFKQKISLDRLSSGVYYLRIRLGEELYSMPIVKL
ncbi:MAG TPA: T9SS type A sorting domain-containing protein [Bacteroidetes bacterium]|nr:T9SS type A sorting domain-containing protein [Bacteroidota bacterium]